MGVHPDFALVAPESGSRAVKIEQVRELQQKVSFSSTTGRGRVFVIDGVEWLREEAADALLKTLEEPPENTTIILVSPSPGALLPTIVSRCQTVRFRPLPPETIAEQLRNRHDLAASQLELAALFADGSLGHAIQICEALAAETSDVFNTRTSLIERVDDLDPVTEVTLPNDLSKSTRSKKSKTGESARQKTADMLRFLILFYRDVLSFQFLNENGTLFNIDLRLRIRQRALATSPAAVLQILDALMDARRKLMQNVNQQLLLGNLVSQIREIQSRAVRYHKTAKNHFLNVGAALARRPEAAKPGGARGPG